MNNGNETGLKVCRFLDDSYFQSLYDAFIEAFSDYVVPFALTEIQFKNHIILNGVDLQRTVGCLIGEQLIGFSLNGFGDWHGRSTVYDAGTGVVPAHRRKGLSRAMFELMLPRFKTDGIKQCLLEVVTSNTAAVGLYEKLGFATGRILALLQCDDKIVSPVEIPQGIEIRVITKPDWDLFTKFWDGHPSWQNSVEAIARSRKIKRIVGAWNGARCVGYIVFSSTFGRVAQIAVDREFRNRGVGTALARTMQAETADGFSMQVINIDKSLENAVSFFRKLGFYERLSQYEMVLPL
jgi:ribosomal protein S18 acetylase RimI-like enzyme